MTGESSTRYPGADPWRRIADEVDRLDPDAGRTLHSALARCTAPLRIQVAGRAGVGRADVQRALAGLPASPESAVIDVPGTPDPVLDADVVIYVLPSRLDPVTVHPADRRALAALDSRRVIVVVAGDTPVRGLGASVFTRDDPNLEAVILDQLDRAHSGRFEDFVTSVAGIAASPQARDVIEAALESPAEPGSSLSGFSGPDVPTSNVPVP
ncbi:hypothetical protein HCA61_06220 [Rhodococcus sp. HNM0563]|uniref:hypothetical protein n=1 Tax=unclassified Rhodococcus (in: high G+C Gram-positive bacteria) TaxID=192944 RepID=UPI00146B2656|nr:MULTISPECIES: hypothetical protein [unclassified Rhodococcus (in: high G+C Gram-positive bacteria)]MCK0090661.1 hypothetical protein [Rhodococcus sp. F64268]NLU61855.1 hypothetical protein [Rhodococcus sp. HNM0563]